MEISQIDFKHGAGLAPMAGVTDLPMRLLCREQGAAWSVSEMMSAKGFLYMGLKHRATKDLLMHVSHEGTVALQLFGREPDLMAEAANQLQDIGFDFIDVNMGCPAPKITGNGEGSALMKEPEQAEKVIAAMVKRVHCPVTVKMRSGWDEEHINAVEFAQRLEGAGAVALTVHGRTRMQFYRDTADWNVIKAVKQAVQIPVFGNGDIKNAEHALEMLRLTKCDGVMIGRAAQGNPWIFKEIACALNGMEYRAPTIAERVETALKHLDMECALKGEHRAIPEMRKHIAWYMAGERGCVKIRQMVNTLQTQQSVREVLLTYLEEVQEILPNSPAAV